LERMQTGFNVKKALQLPTCKGMELIEVDSIIRIEAISNYSKLYFSGGKTLVVAKVLRWFEEKLPVNCFIRVHKKHLLNKTYIRDYIKGTLQQSQGGKVGLSNGEWISVSKRKNTYFLQYWLNTAA
jgi:two-component system LytT family response regulator